MLRMENKDLWQVSRELLDEFVTPDGNRRGVGSTAKPTLGFPLGTALVLLIVFGVSAVFSCCYHWDKIRTLSGRQEQQPTDQIAEISPVMPSNAFSQSPKATIQQGTSWSMPVLMPGEELPKFIAWPAPCIITQSPKAPATSDPKDLEICVHNK